MFGKLGTPGDDCRDEAMRRVSHQGDLGSREPVRLRIMEWFLLDGLTVAVPVRLERKGVLAGRCVGVDRLQAVLESFPELRRVEKRQSCMNYLEEDLDQVKSKTVGSVRTRDTRLYSSELNLMGGSCAGATSCSDGIEAHTLF